MKNHTLNKKSLISIGLLMGLGFASSSQAITYTYDIDNPRQSSNAGYINNISTQYDSNLNTLSWKSTTSTFNSNLADGFWLVISDGAMPQYRQNEYSIFYGDLATGNLTSYVYQGSRSWSTSEYIQSFSGAINTDYSVNGEVTFDFSIDVASINSFVPDTNGGMRTNNWDGAQFDQGIGVWYRPFVMRNGPQYNLDGSLASLKYGAAGWYDKAYLQAEVVDVPEPGILALTGLGLLGMVVAHRRRKI